MRALKVVALCFAGLSVAGCVSDDDLKNPCERPKLELSYGPDDCGPVRPVNQAMDVIMGAKPGQELQSTEKMVQP